MILLHLPYANEVFVCTLVLICFFICIIFYLVKRIFKLYFIREKKYSVFGLIALNFIFLLIILI